MIQPRVVIIIIIEFECESKAIASKKSNSTVQNKLFEINSFKIFRYFHICVLSKGKVKIKRNIIGASVPVTLR